MRNRIDMALLRLGRLALALSLLSTATAAAARGEGDDQWKPPKNHCEQITIPMCRDLGYNFTVMPNFVNNVDQEQAERELQDYMPLVEAKCSVHIRFFLCSVFAPLCSDEVAEGIASCRPLCLQVRKDCLPILKRLDMAWPHRFECSRFLESDVDQLCMQYPNASEAGGRRKAAEDEEAWASSENGSWFDGGSQWPFGAPGDGTAPCPPNFARARDAATVVCAPKCGKDGYYRIEDKRFAESWFTAWAWLCFLSTLFTLLTFCVDSTRFRYPERPVVFLAMCNNAIAVAYVVRGSFGSRSLSCAEPSDGGDGYVAVDGLESASCTFLFLVLYYFSMASSVWFVNLVLSWYLSAAKKWSTEALENVSSYFHAAAWSVPAAFSVGALVLRKVSADELTGLCQIADAAAVPFVVAPHAALLFAGFALACLGGAALVRVRRAVKAVGRSTSKLERLMSRLAAFGLLFALPALGSLACVLYESLNRPVWQSASQRAALECQFRAGCASPSSTGAGVEVALLRLFLSLAGGIAAGMWVWSGKTCRVWGSLFSAAPDKPARYRRSAVAVAVALAMPKRHISSSLYGRSMHVSRV